MAHMFFSNLSVLRRRMRYVFLAFVWLAGLLFGALSAPYASDSYFLMMRTAAQGPVSISGLFLCAVLPFLLTAFAVYISRPSLIYAVIFGKAFLFSFCFYGISAVFGSAGWLVLFLLQFSDCCLIPVLCWFCIRCISGTHRLFRRDLSICLAAALIVGIMDYCTVSPFLVMLIDI